MKKIENIFIKNIYDKLLKEYGVQGWWPIQSHKGSNPTKTGAIHGYHPGDYSFPRTKDEKFEIILGAILTQNTAWPNVEKALNRLLVLANNPKDLLRLSNDMIKEAIKPAGYFNQKTIYLKEISAFLLEKQDQTPSRKELLGVKGIGPETADSILLYAFKEPEFVIDAYTKRICLHLDIINQEEKKTYDEIKNLFEKNLSKDFKLFQEYHALIVEHAKRYYSKRPYNDFVLELFRKK